MDFEIKPGVAYHTKTEADAIDFLNQCDKQGIKWANGKKASELSNWEVHEENTCYIYTNNHYIPDGIRYISEYGSKAAGFDVVEYVSSCN